MCPGEGSDTSIALSFNYDEAQDELTDVLTYRRVEEPVYVGLVDPAQRIWHLRDGAGSVKQFFYGNPGDFPILGDWDCDGVDTPGMYRQSDGFVYLRNSNTQGNADRKFFFGNPGDIPIVGDFNNNGCDTVSIYRPSQGRVFIINLLGEDGGGLAGAQLDYYFGNPGDKPFVGDFDGDGIDTTGLHRETSGSVYFRNSHTQGHANTEIIYGNPGDRLVAADWIDDGSDAWAIFRPSSTAFFFRFTNTQGVANDVLPRGSGNGYPSPGILDHWQRRSVTCPTRRPASRPHPPIAPASKPQKRTSPLSCPISTGSTVTATASAARPRFGRGLRRPHVAGLVRSATSICTSRAMCMGARFSIGEVGAPPRHGRTGTASRTRARWAKGGVMKAELDTTRDVPAFGPAVDDREFSIARKGYERSEVRAYLAEIEANLRLFEDWAQRTNAKLAIAEEKNRAIADIDAAVVGVFKEKERMLEKARLDAERIEAEALDQARADAEAVASEIVTAAHEEARRVAETALAATAQSTDKTILAAARAEADRLIREGRAEAERVINDAQAESATSRFVADVSTGEGRSVPDAAIGSATVARLIADVEDVQVHLNRGRTEEALPVNSRSENRSAAHIGSGDDAGARSRYERTSAKLPSIGDDANEALGLIERLRRRIQDA